MILILSYRRTGKPLPQGKIDEHGLEEIPNFSSPEKPAPQVNGVDYDDTTAGATFTADDSMDIVQSMYSRLGSVCR